MDRLDDLISALNNHIINLELEECPDCDKEIDDLRSVIQLLRAGAEMRGRVHLEWQHPTLGYRPMYVDDEIAEYAKDWDAALEGV